MPLYLNHTPIVALGDGLYEIDVVKYGVYVLLQKGPATKIGAPFGAIAWRSADWYQPDGPKRKRA